jgi:hypothetical protein
MKKQFKCLLLTTAILLSGTVVAGDHIPGDVYINSDSSFMSTSMNLHYNPDPNGLASYMRIDVDDDAVDISGTDGMYDGHFFNCQITASTNPQLYADTKEIVIALKQNIKFQVRRGEIPEGGTVSECTEVSISNSTSYGE